MEAGLEHFDMGLVNYRQHPTNVNYIVYRFKDIERANTFEEKLKEAKIWYERSNPEEDEKQVYMFGVEKKFFKQTQRINFMTEAKHKKFMLSNRWIRSFFVLFFIGVVVLASIGYCKSRTKLKEETQRIESAQHNFSFTPTLYKLNASFS
jgi:hypothetical protein